MSINSQVVVDFFALLVIGGLLGMLALFFPLDIGLRLRKSALDVLALVAICATLGSLYLSEIVGLVPCELCWFQRIAMYPLAILIPIARIRRDRGILPYVLALSVIGLCISAYHVQLQLFPEQSSFCELDNPCSNTLAEAFGVITIPQLTAGCFIILTTISITALRYDHRLESP